MAEIFYRVPKEELEEIYRFHYKYIVDKRSQYTWKWEYGSLNPYNSLLLAVKDDNKVVATQGMMSIKISFGNMVSITGKNESLLIDSEYRGKSLSTRLYNYAIAEYEKEDISCLWGFSSKAIIPLRKAKFKIFENIMSRMILSTNINQALQLIPKSNLSNSRGLILKAEVCLATIYSSVIFFLRWMFKYKDKNFTTIHTELKSSNDILDLFDKLLLQNSSLIFTYQDAEYFDWRIKKAPFPIKTFFIYEKNELKGYMYLTIHEKYCEITDFTFIEDRYGKLLMCELINIIRQNHYGFVYYTGNKFNVLIDKVFKLLRKYGFLKMKGPSHFVLRNLKFKEEDVLFKIENWYLNELWSEGV